MEESWLGIKWSGSISTAGPACALVNGRAITKNFHVTIKIYHDHDNRYYHDIINFTYITKIV